MTTTGVWRKLDPAQSGRLRSCEREVLWAAQIPAAAGAALSSARREPARDALRVWARADALMSTELSDDGARAGLRLPDLTLLIWDAEGLELASRSLRGRTLSQGLRWLSEELSEALLCPVQLLRPTHAPPPNPVGAGAPFSGEDGAALATLADWFANAEHLLEPIREAHPGATELRCRPPRLELATRLSFDPRGRGQEERSIGVGMSPGDESCPAPHFYVEPRPPPRTAQLPSLPIGGRWQTAGRTRAVLSGTDLVSDADAQREQARSFLEGAIGACRALLD